MISYGCAETAAGAAGSGCMGNAQQQGFICYCSTDGCNNPIVNTMGRMKRQAKSRKEKRRARRTTNKKRSVRKARRDGKTEIPFSAIPNDQQRQKRTKKSLRKRSYLMRRPSTVNIQSNESRPSEDEQVVPTLAAPIGPSNRKKRSFLPTGQARLVDTADVDEKGEQVNISHVRASRNVNMDILLPPAANDRVYVKGVKPKGKNLSQQKANEQMSTKAVGADLKNEENDYGANSDVSLEDDNFDSEDYSYMDGYDSVEEPSDQAVENELTPVIADLNKMNTTTRIVQNDATIGKEPPHLSVLNGILNSLLNSNETVNLDDPQNLAKDVLDGMVQN